MIKKEKRKKRKKTRRKGERRKGIKRFCAAEAYRTRPTYYPLISSHAICRTSITNVFLKKCAETGVKDKAL